MVTRQLGLGTISYLATLPDANTLAALLKLALTEVHLQTESNIPSQVEICVREAASGPARRRVYIVINHSERPSHVMLPGRYRAIVDASALTFTDAAKSAITQLSLPPQGVAVLLSELDQP